jgi:hypothetical protein
MTGTLTNGSSSVPVQGTGSLSGTIGAGTNPSVNITFRLGGCPNYSAAFSGAYDTSNQKLTLSGPVDIVDQNCTVQIRYNSTIILSR